MKKSPINNALRALATAFFLLTSAQSGAALLQASAPDQVDLGQTFDVLIDVADLGPSGLAAFTIDIAYDDSLFQFDDYVLGPDLLAVDDLSLGDLGGAVALGWDAFFGSILSGPDAQLATLTFISVAAGSGGFEFSFSELVDGNSSLIDVNLQPADTAVASTPATVSLLALALAGFVGRRRRFLSRL